MNQIKMIMIVIGLACFMTAGVASAATVELDDDSGKNAFTMVDCNLLANDVDIMLTDGVVGGIDCDEDNNAIGLSTCHTAGLTSERSEDVDGTTETVSGASFPSASTLQGTVSSSFPEQSCDVTNAVGAATAKKDKDLAEEGS
ncbi:MAG: hypothetical protein ACLFV1_11025 [Thiohalophilus sp.]